MSEETKIDFEELKKEATLLTDPEIPESVMNAPMSDGNTSIDTDGLIISDDDFDDDEVSRDTEATYDGPGMVIDTPKPQADTTYKVGPMANKERVEGVENTLADMDEQIIEAHKQFMEITKGGKAIPAADDEKKASPEEVTLIIDKSGMGSVVFTEEEKKRIELAKKIKLVEVSEKKLKTLKIKKKLTDEDNFEVVQKSFDKSLSPVIALASGYTGRMGNISAIEAIKLTQRPGDDTANTVLEKWSLIYEKLKDVSIGKFETFDDFLSNTAFADYDSFVYGLLCSSYPEEDSISFTCQTPECVKKGVADFEINYRNKELIRTDIITEEQKEAIAEIINSAAIVDEAKKVHEEAPVNQTFRFAFDDESGIIIDFGILSVKDVIERLYNKLSDDLLVEENRPAILLAHSIKAIYVPDYDAEGDEYEYYEITDLNKIVATVNNFNEYQNNLITTFLDRLNSRYQIQFGFASVECPNCHHNYGEYNMDLDRIVFLRVQRRLNTQIG